MIKNKSDIMKSKDEKMKNEFSFNLDEQLIYNSLMQ